MMIRRTGRPGRSGITLTEILISIMILGIGLVSLATLFPLGLLRLREANRMARSTYLSESAESDIRARNLLHEDTFRIPLYSPWYLIDPTTPGSARYDPWIQDTPSFLANPFVSPFGVYAGWGSFPAGPPPLPGTTISGEIPGQGLPVAYDPLWRFQTAAYLPWPPPSPIMPLAAPANVTVQEARFASGIGFVRPDPHPGTSSSLPSAHGLQRITNFNPSLASAAAVPDIFVSPEDLVLQSDKDRAPGAGSLSPLVPEMNQALAGSTTGMPYSQNDWRYTWMITGQRNGARDGTRYDCDFVIFENRPFSLDTLVAPLPFPPGPNVTVAGEPVVEAVFGYTSNVYPPNLPLGYGINAKRTVLLRWPATQPDPEVKIGSWIADVTYERNFVEDYQRAVRDAPISATTVDSPTYQRCFWYQVAKRTSPGPGVALTGDPAGVNYREMTVWTASNLKALTLLDRSTGHPYHVNAALVSPYVVNVISKPVQMRSR